MTPPSARCVRWVKLFFFLQVMIAMSVFIFLCAHTMSENEKQTIMTRKMAETTGICNKLNSRSNSSLMHLLPNTYEICLQLQQDLKLFYSKRATKVNPYTHRFIISGGHICNENTQSVLVVHSLHAHVDHRSAIRETWGRAAQSKTWPVYPFRHNTEIKLVFVFGLHRNHSWNRLVAKESLDNGDIIMGDFVEDYKNMTLKSLLGLKWVLQYCPKIQFLIKSDDDMVLNIPYLLRIIGRTNMTYGIMGPYNPASESLRKGKWAISKEQFPFYNYPPYESGSCYIIDGSLISKLYETAEYVPWIYIDDVYITGILGRILGVRHIIQHGFAYWVTKSPEPCDIEQNRVVTGTKMTPKKLRHLWSKLNSNLNCKGTTARTREVVI